MNPNLRRLCSCIVFLFARMNPCTQSSQRICKRALQWVAHLQKITYKDKASYAFKPPCTQSSQTTFGVWVTLLPTLYTSSAGWWRLIGSPKLQIIFHKRAITYRPLLREMTYEDTGSDESSPPCTQFVYTNESQSEKMVYLYCVLVLCCCIELLYCVLRLCSWIVFLDCVVVLSCCVVFLCCVLELCCCIVLLYCVLKLCS